jgi:hypothetical protein
LQMIERMACPEPFDLTQDKLGKGIVDPKNGRCPYFYPKLFTPPLSSPIPSTGSGHGKGEERYFFNSPAVLFSALIFTCIFLFSM